MLAQSRQPYGKNLACEAYCLVLICFMHCRALPPAIKLHSSVYLMNLHAVSPWQANMFCMFIFHICLKVLRLCFEKLLPGAVI